MTIEQVNYENGGYFLAQSSGVEAGRMTYSWISPAELIIRHTAIDEAFKGKGIGKQLLRSLVDFARANDIKVSSECPFAKAMFEKIPGLQSVLKNKN